MGKSEREKVACRFSPATLNLTRPCCLSGPACVCFFSFSVERCRW